jgi:hypothetical protein
MAVPHLERWAKHMIRILVFIVMITTAVTATEPREVAEEAIAAWAARDAKRLDAVAHPELKKRCRTARLTQFYIESKAEKKKIIESGSDADAFGVFCEALKEISPRDDRLEYSAYYIESSMRDGLAIFIFDLGWKAKDGSTRDSSSKTEIVLKKNGDDWRFLWSRAIQIHVDLMWNPIE